MPGEPAENSKEAGKKKAAELSAEELYLPFANIERVMKSALEDSHRFKPQILKQAEKVKS